VLDDTAPGRRLLFAAAARRHRRDSDSTLAAHLALDLLAETANLPIDRAFAREAETASQLIVGSDAQGRLHSRRFTERAIRRISMGAGDLESAAVLGSGQTGSDLAHRLASAGSLVRIKDDRLELVRQGAGRVRQRLAWEVAQGRITDQQARRRAEGITGATGFGGFGTLEVLIAAPDEGSRGVEELLLEAEAHVREGCLIAFHDWVASATHVQRTLRRPDRVVGLAASLPLERFSLLEIVPGALTAPDTVALARRLARRLALMPVVVGDETPTPGSRLLGTYFAEATHLVQEGATVGQVDEAAEEFGFDVGPFHRMDAIGTRRSLRLLESLAARAGARFAAAPVLARIAGSGGTFYRYQNGRPAGPNRTLPAGLSPGGSAVAALIRRRLLLLLINEAALILEDGGVADAGDLEVIAVHGLGFPEARGGLLFHADSIGAGPLVADLAKLAARSGERFQPAGLLRDLAASGGAFFGADGSAASGQGAGPMVR
jgi:3-hydroxyacyl-CoA dehydrogenase